MTYLTIISSRGAVQPLARGVIVAGRASRGIHRDSEHKASEAAETAHAVNPSRAIVGTAFAKCTQFSRAQCPALKNRQSAANHLRCERRHTTILREGTCA